MSNSTNVRTNSNSKTQRNVELERSSTRHFYAVKEDAKGETPYVFERIADRNAWMERYETAKPASATEVYKLLRKQRNGILAANRKNRVYVVDSVEAIDPNKGHRLILS